MSDPLAFPPANAPRMIWVFALDAPVEEHARWEAPGDDGSWPLPKALGVEALDAAHVEVFPQTHIAEYGLVRYLTDANGMSVESVATDKAVLSVLGGLIVLVHAKAVAGRDGAFAPKSPARFIGRYQQDTGLSASIPTPATDLTRGVVAGSGANAPATKSRAPWAVILAAGIIILAIVVALGAL